MSLLEPLFRTVRVYSPLVLDESLTRNAPSSVSRNLEATSSLGGGGGAVTIDELTVQASCNRNSYKQCILIACEPYKIWHNRYMYMYVVLHLEQPYSVTLVSLVQ